MPALPLQFEICASKDEAVCAKSAVPQSCKKPIQGAASLPVATAQRVHCGAPTGVHINSVASAGVGVPAESETTRSNRHSWAVVRRGQRTLIQRTQRLSCQAHHHHQESLYL